MFGFVPDRIAVRILRPFFDHVVTELPDVYLRSNLEKVGHHRVVVDEFVGGQMPFHVHFQLAGECRFALEIDQILQAVLRFHDDHGPPAFQFIVVIPPLRPLPHHRQPGRLGLLPRKVFEQQAVFGADCKIVVIMFHTIS